MHFKSAVNGTMRYDRLMLVVAFIGCLNLQNRQLAGQSVPRPFGLDSRADNDPILDVGPMVYVVPSDTIPLWKMALERDENEVRRQAAEAICDAQLSGTKGLKTLVPFLRKVLVTPNDDRTVQLAALRALVALDDRGSAEALYTVSQKLGADAADVLEPKLSEWKYEPIVAVWRERLDDQLIGSRYRVLAFRGLAAAQDTKSGALASGALASGALAAKISADQTETVAVRIEAAKTAGVLRTSGVEAVAMALWTENSGMIDRLVATHWLLHHRAAIDELLHFAEHSRPAVQRLAILRLNVVAADKLVPLYPKFAASGDAKIRELAVVNLNAFPNIENARRIGPALDDHHPDVRNAARETLVEFSKKSDEIHAVVIEETLKHLHGNSWRGLQQSVRLVGQIDYEPAASRCLELLRSPRAEVHTTAAWTIRKLEIKETLPPAFQHAKDLFHWMMSRPPPGEPQFKPVEPGSNDEDVAQLVVLFGLMGFKEAEPFMRKMIPKDSATVTARVGSITALGYLHRDNPPQDGLVQALVGRLSDTTSDPPEEEGVRTACALALGRMKAESALPQLRHFYELDGAGRNSGFACAWAIEQITGEAFERSGPQYIQFRTQFLVPTINSR